MKLGSLGILTIVHAVLALLLIIELGLTAYLVDVSYWTWSPSQFNFMVFNSVWSILVLLYIAITPVVIPKLYLPIVAVPLLAVTSLFWFAGSIAMAVLIGVPHCDGNGRCQTAQAGVAFGFFLWVAFTGLAIVDGLAFWRSRGHGAHADTRSKASAYPGA